MKKLLTVSIMAVMAVTAANAEIASKAYVDQQDDAVEAIVTALSGKVGTVPENKTVVGMIADAQSAATYDDTALKAKVTANETAISTINSSDPMTSGITAAKVEQYDAYATGKQDKLTFDSTPTANSTNPVTSGGVKAALDSATGDVTALDTRLTTAEGKITTAEGKITTAEGKIADIEGSDYATSGITAAKVQQYDAYAEGKQDKLTFDSTPTANSTNPVTSGGVKAALDSAAGDVTSLTTKVTALETKTANMGSMANEDAANYTKTADLDSSTTATTGQVVTAISMTDGELSQTTADPLSVTNYANVAGATANGQYVLTKYVDGSNTTFKWELISRTGNESL